MSDGDDRVVVWDLGNVVIPWDRRGALARFVEDEAEVERLAAEVFDLATNVHLDRGDPLHEVVAIVEERHPGHGWVVEGYVEHFRHSLGPADPAVEALIEELLARSVRNVGLSNWSAVCFVGIPEDVRAIGLLEGVVISGEERICKPDAEIFRRCEERFGFEPEQALFFDDSAANVDAARAVGWDAEVFTDAEAARRVLVSRGLLPGT